MAASTSGGSGGGRERAPLDALTEATLTRLRGLWRASLVDIDRRITAITNKIDAAQRAGQPVNISWLSEQRRLETIRATIQADVSRFADRVRVQVADAQRIAATMGERSAYDTLNATIPPGVSYTFGVPPASVRQQLITATMPDSPLSALFDALGAQAADAAAQALFTGVTLGDNPRTIARAMRAACDLSAQRAEVIARTETLRAYRRAALEGYRANREVVPQWRWQSALSARTCGVCLALDGTLHSVDEELNDHICGRCTAVPVTKSWADILGPLGIDASGIPETSASADTTSETGAQWFDRQSEATQNSILGPAKATAYRAGDLTLAQLVDIQTDPVWGMSVREKSLNELGLSAQTYLQRARRKGR